MIGFRADPELQARIEELAQKSTEGQLTEDEPAEYAGYVRANKFVAILKRQAQQLANSLVIDDPLTDQGSGSQTRSKRLCQLRTYH